MSIGFLLPNEDAPVIWRGPKKTGNFFWFYRRKYRNKCNQHHPNLIRNDSTIYIQCILGWTWLSYHWYTSRYFSFSFLFLFSSKETNWNINLSDRYIRWTYFHCRTFNWFQSWWCCPCNNSSSWFLFFFQFFFFQIFCFIN